MPTFRTLLVAAGILSLALGLLGLIIPGLPTVPFLILSAYLFSKSSPRLHARLLQHPQLGPMIQDWQERRAIPRRAKIAATVMVTLSLILIWNRSEWPIPARSLTTSLIAAAMLYVWTRPDGISRS